MEPQPRTALYHVTLTVGVDVTAPDQETARQAARQYVEKSLARHSYARATHVQKLRDVVRGAL